MTISEQCQPRHPGISQAELIDLRAAVNQSKNAAVEPNIFLIDFLPRGRHGDLEKTLRYLRCRGITSCLLGFRDVVENPGWLPDAHLEEMHDHCDAIWVYGDAVIYDPVILSTCGKQVAGRDAANVRGASGARYRIVRNDENRHDQAKPVDHRSQLHPLAVDPIESHGLWRIQRWN
jgi:hypothetical protein